MTPSFCCRFFCVAFFRFDHHLEFVADEELDGTGLDERPSGFVGDADTTMMARSVRMTLQCSSVVWAPTKFNNRLLPARRFKQHGASGVDGPHPEPQFGFDAVTGSDAELAFLIHPKRSCLECATRVQRKSFCTPCKRGILSVCEFAKVPARRPRQQNNAGQSSRTGASWTHTP